MPYLEFLRSISTDNAKSFTDDLAGRLIDGFVTMVGFSPVLSMALGAAMFVVSILLVFDVPTKYFIATLVGMTLGASLTLLVVFITDHQEAVLTVLPTSTNGIIATVIGIIVAFGIFAALLPLETRDGYPTS